MKKLYSIILIICFLAVIFSVPILTKIEKPEEISFIENRTLKKAPVYSKDALFDGTYLPEWEEYFSDHIVFRDKMIYLYTYLNANILNKTVVNDIVITEKALLPFNDVYVTNEEEIKHSSEAMAEKIKLLSDKVSESGARFVYVGIPEQSSALRGEYPYYLENKDEYLTCVEKTFFEDLEKKNIEYINMMDIFKDEDYFSYYSVTDHHYNIHGAFRTYEEIVDALSLNALSKEDFLYTELKNDFFGSRARIIHQAYKIPDKLGYYEPKIAIPFERYDSGTKLDWIIKKPKSESEDITYNVYMGWDSGETYIHTHRPELPKILIFGDSFTNPLETLLYTACDSLLSVDLRHNSKSIYDYIDEFQPDIVLMVRDDTCYLSFDGNGKF